MGKGDKKTRKGKIYAGSHGNKRAPTVKAKATTTAQPAVKAAKPVVKAPVKKVAVKKAAPKKSA